MVGMDSTRTLEDLCITLPRQVTFHDLPVVYPDGERPAKYRVVEVGSVGFHIVGPMLRDASWRGEAIATIMLLHFPLAQEDRAGLPPGVLWLRASDDVAAQLRLLRMVLVEPLENRTWPCVDAMDYAAALGRGGEIRLFEVAACSSFQQAMRELRNALQVHSPGKSVCLQVRTPPDEDPLKMLDEVAAGLERQWPLDEDALLVMSRMNARANQYQIILMVNR